MIILLIFRGFAREKKQESSENFTIVLNLFAEIIVHSAFFYIGIYALEDGNRNQ